MRTTLCAGATLCAAAVVGCAGPTDGPRDAGQVRIEVAPLTLTGLTDAEYTVTVTNGPGGSGETVWTKALSSSRYGDGAGSLSYVGTCDAGDDGVSTVTVTLDALRTAGGVLDPTTYDNPGALSKEVVCVANADVAVTFDLTVVRQAQQGFFDVAVTFDDIFCSAKLDCETGSGDDLELLHHPATGARDLTAVFGFACTGSPTGTTFLYMDDLVVSCTGLTLDVRVDPTGRGNLDTTAAPGANADGYLFAASVFRGVEGFAGKAYWNVSLGLDETKFAAAKDCTLTGRATASSAPFPQELDGFPLPEGSVYPVIDWSVQLSNATGRVCETHAVNEAGSGVETRYLGYLPALNQFTWAGEPIYLDARFEPEADVVLRAAAAICNPACVHGGCVATDTCECAGTGYSGPTCATPVCAAPCENGGVCVAPDTCACAGTGYAGATCGVDVDECAEGSDNCSADAACANTAGGFTCACDPGSSGDGVTCTACIAGEVQPDPGQATCVPCGPGTWDDGDEICATCASCASGEYVDVACSATGNTQCLPCSSVSGCVGDVTCTTSGDSFCDLCQAGYAQESPGDPCADVDECAEGSDNCSADAACANTAGGFTCACDPGFAGDGVTCTACIAGEVQPNPGQATCVPCGPGTWDDGDEICATCASCASGEYVDVACSATGNTQCLPCSSVGGCVGGVTCTTDTDSACALCPAGYEQVSPGAPCTDVDECAEGSDNCSADAACANTAGGFTCACDPGFSGDGVTCTACVAGEVQPNPGQPTCQPCAPGSYDDGDEICATCATCSPGEYVDVACSATANTQCLPCPSVSGCVGDVTCTTSGDSFCDLCQAGYAQVSPGDPCADVDECAEGSDNCSADAACANTAGGFTCACDPGFAGDGVTCTACIAGEVQPNPGQPTCQPCAPGTWDDGDEICATCASCASGEYVDVACSATGNTQCLPCSSVSGCVGDVTCTTSGDSLCDLCQAGYAQVSPGAPCTDVDECTDGDGCDENAACANTAGAYTCTCAGGAGYGDGVSCTYATDCLDLRQTDPGATTGVHWIDPDGVGGGAAFEAYCEMDTDGGGWTLAMTSSDDGVATWTWNNRALMTTDETLVGSASAPTHDYKGLAHHRLGFSALLFKHAPSGVWAEYGVDSHGADLGSFIGGVAFPHCPTSGNLGYELLAGTLDGVNGGAHGLCETDLYFNLGDDDGAGHANCLAEGVAAWNGTMGPVWNENNNEGCDFDDPAHSGFGPYYPCADCGAGAADTEFAGRGFGGVLSLNTGTAGAAANRLQAFVRDYPLRDCLAWKGADKAATSGVYTIDPDGLAGPVAPFDVYCDMATEGGGWTLLYSSSDDGVATFTYANVALLTTDTSEVGSPTLPNRDYKSRALNELPFTSLLFRHQPSSKRARYGIYSAGADLGTFLAAQPEPSCPDGPGNGYAMIDGDIAPTTGTPRLCETDLYFNLGDRDAPSVSIAQCLDRSSATNQDAWGPVWNVGVNNGCDFDDPGGYSTGPRFDLAGSNLTVESNGRGFGAALGLNTGTGGAGQNYIQTYGRDYPLRSCNEWRLAGRTEDAVYTIDVDGLAGVMVPFDVYCDMTTEGGGWTEIPYAADLAYQHHYDAAGDVVRWLPANFTVGMSAARVNALKALSTEGRQTYVGLCNGVIHYLYASTSDYGYAFGFRFWDGTETGYGAQDYAPLGTEPYAITVTQDGCKTNGSPAEGGTLANATIFDIRSALVPVLNVKTRDNGDAGELFGSPLTSNSAWLR